MVKVYWFGISILDFQGNTLKRANKSEETISPATVWQESQKNTANYFQKLEVQKSKSVTSWRSNIFQLSFEGNQGFGVRTFEGISNGELTSDNRFHDILLQNANSGSQI